MPYVNIKITREGVTTEQKATLIRETTAMLARVLNKDPQTTHVVIDEIDTDNWDLAGESMTHHRKLEGITHKDAIGNQPRGNCNTKGDHHESIRRTHERNSLDRIS